MADQLYDTDFYRWCLEQAALVRQLRAEGLDWENLAEEIESLGKSNKRALRSQLRRLLLHLLKAQRAGETPHSWLSSISSARYEIDGLLIDSPSLRRFFPELLPPEYAHARADAAGEMGLDETEFPAQCPWDISTILDHDFWAVP